MVELVDLVSASKNITNSKYPSVWAGLDLTQWEVCYLSAFARTIASSSCPHQSVTNVFEYSNICYPNIYSDIRSYHFLDTNIFGYSFVARF